jgi:hypothetical protein
MTGMRESTFVGLPVDQMNVRAFRLASTVLQYSGLRTNTMDNEYVVDGRTLV